MKLIKTALLILCVALSFTMFAQVQRDPITNQITNFQNATFSKDVTEFRFDNLGQGLQEHGIPYDKIDGSPFWKDSLLPARFYDSKGYIITLLARINIATNKIYFQQNGDELVLNDDIITRIVFLEKDDSLVFISKVPDLLYKNKPLTDFVQVLNAGKYQLLRLTRRKVVSIESPSHTSTSYSFADEVSYFIKSDETVHDVRKLNRESILIFLPTSSAYDGWIKKNNINFRNEKDIVQFMNYYNTRFNN